MPESIQIPSRFNGPRGSGNGGYTAGVVAGLLGGEAEVNLRRPVPLDAELRVVRNGDGEVQVLDGEALVADGRAAEVDVEVPAPVSPSEARLAAERYRGSPDDMFSRCFVWAALDCPTYFAAYMEEEVTVSFLVRFSVRIEADIPASTEHVVIAWPIEAEGRKRQAGSAVLSAGGELLAMASALLVEPRAAHIGGVL